MPGHAHARTHTHAQTDRPTDRPTDRQTDKHLLLRSLGFPFLLAEHELRVQGHLSVKLSAPPTDLIIQILPPALPLVLLLFLPATALLRLRLSCLLHPLEDTAIAVIYLTES